MPLAKAAFEDLTDYSVGFIVGRSDQIGDLGLIGSGTLVSFDGFRAILTAHHVLTALPDTGLVGLLTPTRFGSRIHRLNVNMQYIKKVFIAKGLNDAQGPDLGLLILAPTDWSKFPSGKTFYNLAKRRDFVLNQLPGVNRGAWVLCGMVGERTRELDARDESRYGKGKSFLGIMINAIHAGQREADGYDFISVEVEYNDSYEGPESFGGCSGGGLWQLLISEKEDGSLEIFHSLLAGVAFYQSGMNGLRRTIECHGWKSLYKKVIDAIQIEKQTGSVSR